MAAAENLEKELQIAQKAIFELKNQCKTDFDRLVSQEELIQARFQILKHDVEIWLFDQFFGIFDLRWPLVTSKQTFSRSLRQELHFAIQFAYFQ